MKTLLITILGFAFLTANITTPNNFSIDDGQVIWQKIYDTQHSKEELIQLVRKSGYFRNISVYKDNLVAEISELDIDHRDDVNLDMSRPWYLIRNHIKSYVILEFKENKYRVTLKSIKLTPLTNGTELNSKVIDLESFVVKRKENEFKQKFIEKGSEIMDHTFQKITDFQKIKITKDW